ncbi:MAG: glycosyltransferase [Tissierellia bacterium]|nr:glycosyltransferase [Tissierellia bacterium]
MNKIKVMHIITDTNFGGAGKYLYQICKYIDKNKFKIIVALPEGSVLNNIISTISDIEIAEIDGIDTKSFDILGVKEVYRLIKRYKPDIIHSHACLSARIAGIISGNKKIIYTRHSLLPKMKGIKKWAKILLSRILPSKIIAVSKAVEENLLDEGEKRENIFLVYNGVELPNIKHEKLREKYLFNQEDIIISLVGRLERVKGQEHLLKIAEILANTETGFEILLVGEGSQRTNLESYVRANDLNVKFLGHINEIDEIYDISDIIVNTSNSEALSFTVIEAFAHKKPVVAFNIDGIKEVVSDGEDGYLVDFLDYDDFALKLSILMKKKDLRKQFGQRGYEKVKAKFTVAEMVRNIENIYGGIM